jgi:transcriptional regulator with XRE-family HTH domain
MKQTLAELRNKRGLTQRALAYKLSNLEQNINFSAASIALYELGLRTPLLHKAKLIAHYFDIPVEDILFGPAACKRQAKLGKYPE